LGIHERPPIVRACLQARVGALARYGICLSGDFAFSFCLGASVRASAVLLPRARVGGRGGDLLVLDNLQFYPACYCYMHCSVLGLCTPCSDSALRARTLCAVLPSGRPSMLIPAITVEGSLDVGHGRNERGLIARIAQYGPTPSLFNPFPEDGHRSYPDVCRTRIDTGMTRVSSSRSGCALLSCGL
jgi:hypothetical protein